MKFLLDENVPKSIKKLIIELGFSVITLKELNKLGITNGEVAETAINENSIIITLDSDFLTFKKELLLKSRIIYIKIHPRDPKTVLQLINDNLETCINMLSKPGKILITKHDCILKKPLEY